MKYLIVVRHGECGVDDHLSNRGRDQIEILARIFKRYVKESSVCILSSTMPRASESAEIIAKVFNVDSFSGHEVLWSEHDHPMNLPAALELVRSHKDMADVLILVTHHEYAGKLPAYFSGHELGVMLQSTSIEYGEAWFIDCIEKKLKHVY